MRPRLTLKSRFTLVAAGSVAAVALAITAVAFLAIRTDLQNQVRQELAARAYAVEHEARQLHDRIPANWIPPSSSKFGLTYTQLITSAGVVWAPIGDAGLLTPSETAIAVAAGAAPSLYATLQVSGTRAMVLTAPLAPGLAIQVAEPLTSTDAEVARVGETLATLSAIGVAVATVLGWAVARAGLSPVTRLASVAEEVSLTGDPGRRVEVGRGDELGRLAATFNAMLGALQRSLSAQRRLVSDASHELRTPLTSLRINVDILAENPDLPAAERKEVLARVSDQVDELSRLVAGVTDLARGEPPAVDRFPVHLNAVVAGALEAARRDWPNTEFTVGLAGGVVEGNAERLRVAVKNLLDNAAKFGPPGGPVEVRLAGGELTVRDHGPGIDDEDLPFVFDRFYRAPSSRSAPGSGLGLAVVHEIALRHEGTVSAESASGNGTIMRLSLPVRTPAAPTQEGARSGSG
ncbi:MAG TPA: HAMP domain-containing sensor histidine kinase [Trebonia sp.]|nr:HAMP domain-containing sensor histidine kinase [Trebonia sp.]